MKTSPSNFKLHKLTYKLSNSELNRPSTLSWFRGTNYTNNNIQIKLPEYIESILSVSPVISIWKKFFHRLKWLVTSSFIITFRFITKLIYIHPGYYTPPGDIIKFEYNTKNNILKMINVTAYDNKYYTKIDIMYISKSEDRNEILEKLGI